MSSVERERATAPALADAAGAKTPGAYPWVVVAFLTVVYTVAFIDRQVLNLVIEPMKQSLRLTDTQMSLLQGLAFTCAYVVFSPIMGRLADRANRRNILIIAVAVWSAFTTLGGFATGFWSFFIARVGVGAAEACVTPVCWSLLSDYFSRDRLPRAMSVFLVAPYLGAGLALIFGGILIGNAAELRLLHPALAGFEPWQLVFVVIGAPGLLLAASLVVVREPARAGVGRGAAEQFTIREVGRFFVEGRAFFGRFFAAMAGIIMVLYALPAWTPALLMRRHGVDPRSVGLEYGSVVLVMGTVGVLAGPVLGRWLDRRGYKASTMRVALIAAIGLVPATVALPLAPSYAAGLAAAGVATFFFSLPQAMAATALQLATPPGMRGMAASLYVFLVAVIGLGIAPTIVALLTDYVFGDPGQVGTSLAIVCACASATGAWFAWRALPHYGVAIARAEQRAGIIVS